MRNRVKALIMAVFLFSAVITGLALTPHYTCACGRYEDGSQLTNLINTVSEKIIGKPVFEKKVNPYR